MTGGQAGVLGFCLGGTLAFQVAITSDPDVAVCYYGSGIAGMLDQAERNQLPGAVPLRRLRIRTSRASRAMHVCAFATSRPDMECHIHEDAGHAFDNHEAPMFHQPEPAARAWEITRDFLARTLPA